MGAGCSSNDTTGGKTRRRNQDYLDEHPPACQRHGASGSERELDSQSRRARGNGMAGAEGGEAWCWTCGNTPGQEMDKVFGVELILPPLPALLSDTDNRQSKDAHIEEREILAELDQFDLESIGRYTTEPRDFVKAARVKAMVVKASVMHNINGDATYFKQQPKKYQGQKERSFLEPDQTMVINWWINKVIADSISQSIEEVSDVSRRTAASGAGMSLLSPLPIGTPRGSLQGLGGSTSLRSHSQNSNEGNHRPGHTCSESSPTAGGAEHQHFSPHNITESILQNQKPTDSPYQRFSHSLALRLWRYHLELNTLLSLEEEDSTSRHRQPSSKRPNLFAKTLNITKENFVEPIKEVDRDMVPLQTFFIWMGLHDQRARRSSYDTNQNRLLSAGSRSGSQSGVSSSGAGAVGTPVQHQQTSILAAYPPPSTTQHQDNSSSHGHHHNTIHHLSTSQRSSTLGLSGSASTFVNEASSPGAGGKRQELPTAPVIMGPADRTGGARTVGGMTSLPVLLNNNNNSTSGASYGYSSDSTTPPLSLLIPIVTTTGSSTTPSISPPAQHPPPTAPVVSFPLQDYDNQNTYHHLPPLPQPQIATVSAPSVTTQPGVPEEEPIGGSSPLAVVAHKNSKQEEEDDLGDEPPAVLEQPPIPVFEMSKPSIVHHGVGGKSALLEEEESDEEEQDQEEEEEDVGSVDDIDDDKRWADDERRSAGRLSLAVAGAHHAQEHSNTASESASVSEFTVRSAGMYGVSEIRMPTEVTLLTAKAQVLRRWNTLCDEDKTEFHAGDYTPGSDGLGIPEPLCYEFACQLKGIFLRKVPVQKREDDPIRYWNCVSTLLTTAEVRLGAATSSALSSGNGGTRTKASGGRGYSQNLGRLVTTSGRSTAGLVIMAPPPSNPLSCFKALTWDEENTYV